jgi:hypothetical protein
MAESEPIVIPVRYDFTTADRQMDEREQRARQGVNVNVRGEGAAGGRQGGTRPTGGAPTAPGAIQEEINNAWSRGDTRTAQRLADQARGMGVSVDVPTPVPSAAERGSMLRAQANIRAQEAAGFQRSGEQADAMQRRREAGADRYDTSYENRLVRDRLAEQRQADVLQRRREQLGETRDIQLERREVADRLRAQRAQERTGARVERSWDQAGMAQQRQQERAGERFQSNLDRANLALQNAREREAAAAMKNAQREEQRAQQRAERQATQLERADFAAGLAGMNPTQQLGALQQQIGVESDPLRRAQLQRQANALGGKTGRNREVLGMGNYFTLMFGGWEVASAFIGTRQGQLQASLAATEAERMQILARTSDPSQYGIFGSLIGGAWNLLGAATGIRSPESVNRMAEIETVRAASLDRQRASRFRREDEAALLSKVGDTPYRQEMEQIRLQQTQRHREADEGYRALQARIGFTDDPGLRSTLRMEQQEFIAEKRAADAQRATLEKELSRRMGLETTQMNAATRASNLSFRGSYLRGAIEAINATFNPMVDPTTGVVKGFGGKQFRTAQGTILPGLLATDPDYQRFEAQLNAYESEVGKAQTTEGQRLIEHRSRMEAVRLKLGDHPLQARLELIRGQEEKALEPIDDPDERRRIQAHFRGERDLALQDERAGISDIILNQQTRARVTGALMRRDVIGAEGEGIVGAARAEEAQMRRRGLAPAADMALKLGQESLKLQRQQYLDAFVGVQTSKDFVLGAAVFGKRLPGQAGAQNPIDVLAGIDKKIGDLANPQPADKAAGINVENAQELANLFAQAFAGLIAN